MNKYTPKNTGKNMIRFISKQDRIENITVEEGRGHSVYEEAHYKSRITLVRKWHISIEQ